MSRDSAGESGHGEQFVFPTSRPLASCRNRHSASFTICLEAFVVRQKRKRQAIDRRAAANDSRYDFRSESGGWQYASVRSQALGSIGECLAVPRCIAHRIEKFKLSNDPRFEQQERDIVGLYLNPVNRGWCSSDRKQIQARTGRPNPPFRASFARTSAPRLQAARNHRAPCGVQHSQRDRDRLLPDPVSK